MRSFFFLIITATIAAANPPHKRPAPVAAGVGVGVQAAAPGSLTARDFVVPQPDAMITEYVPVQRAVPQPPRTFREYVYTYTMETTEPQLAAPQYAPQYAPAASWPGAAPAYAPAAAALPAPALAPSFYPVPAVREPVDRRRRSLLELRIFARDRARF